MAKYILQEAGNFNWMAIFALLTFLTVFSIGVWLALRKDSTGDKTYGKPSIG
jgi:type IV secretory pathway VirB10-like protein